MSNPICGLFVGSPFGAIMGWLLIILGYVTNF